MGHVGKRLPTEAGHRSVTRTEGKGQVPPQWMLAWPWPGRPENGVRQLTGYVVRP